jgi:hypothetical protein
MKAVITVHFEGTAIATLDLPDDMNRVELGDLRVRAMDQIKQRHGAGVPMSTAYSRITKIVIGEE